MSDDSTPQEKPELKAGHPPAVKAGGMRITQNKPPHSDKGGNQIGNEDLTGLSGPSAVPSGPVLIAGAPSKGHADFTAEAAQVAHSPKPPAQHANRPQVNIQQPRK